MVWKLTDEGFTVTEPVRYRPWYNFISNADYGLKVSHLGDAYSTTLREPRTAVTHYDFFAPTKGRFVYVKDGGTVWSPSFLPAKTKLDRYSATHAPGYTRWDSEKAGIAVRHTVFVPREGEYEIWMVEVENRKAEAAAVQIFPQAEFLLFPSHAVDPTYYSWYTNSRWDENRQALLLDKLIAPLKTGFFRSVTRPDGFESSFKLFCGDGDGQDPESVRTGKLRNSPSSGGDPYIGAFQHDLNLPAGGTARFVYLLGLGEDTLDRASALISGWDAAQREFDLVTGALKKKLEHPKLKDLPAGTFANWMKTFFPYQVRQQSLGMVRGEYRGFRDVAQDAMGLVPFDPAAARGLVNQMVTKQYSTGRCLRQWNTSGGFNDERDFRDLPFWIALALDYHIQVTGEVSILDDRARWFDTEAESTLWDHAVQGCEYALQLGDHGLVKMGIGDWNDALSGLGVEGGSVWLNQFAYYTLDALDRLAKKTGKTLPFSVKDWQDKLYEGTMRYWNGTHFSRGVTDKGVVVGAEERIFLLPQIWFEISGMAKRNPGLSQIAVDTMLARLENDTGLLKCFPGFDKPDATVGNLSTLTPGMAENFAVYNHSSAFAIYGFFQMGRNDDALRLLKKLIPIYKDIAKTRAEPFVLVNFYNGGYYDYKKGEGGIPWLTGTANWLSRIVFEHLVPKGLISQLE
jgi:cellobiose phosphorylase